MTIPNEVINPVASPKALAYRPSILRNRFWIIEIFFCAAVTASALNRVDEMNETRYSLNRTADEFVDREEDSEGNFMKTRNGNQKSSKAQKAKMKEKIG